MNAQLKYHPRKVFARRNYISGRRNPEPLHIQGWTDIGVRAAADELRRKTDVLYRMDREFFESAENLMAMLRGGE